MCRGNPELQRKSFVRSPVVVAKARAWSSTFYDRLGAAFGNGSTRAAVTSIWRSF